jgi:hypothetical protein
MAWSGWGAGPAGAGSRAPSRIFLVVALAFSVAAAVVGFRARRGMEGGVAAAAALYFAARLLGLGQRKERP